MTGEKDGLDRRDFLRKAAVTTAAAAWAVPVIQTVSASPAFASTQGSPPPGGGGGGSGSGGCFHSISPGKPSGCMETCDGACPGVGNHGTCNDVCKLACNMPENACPPEYCDPACWMCDTITGTRTFTC